MNYRSIDEIYTANKAIRQKLLLTVSSLPEDVINTRPADDKWSIAEIVEHLTLVADGMSRICGKLLKEAGEAGRAYEGTVNISEGFLSKAAEFADVAIDAPDRVKPSGSKSLAESIAAFEEIDRRFDELKPLFETNDGNQNKFPHPYFGDLSAIEWLVLIGGHEVRHLRQIKGMIANAGQ